MGACGSAVMLVFMRLPSAMRTVGCAAAITGLLVAFPASGAASTRTCLKRGKTIAKNSVARVYRYGTHAVPWVDGAKPIKRPAYYGCRLKNGKARRLVLAGDEPRLLVLRGVYVAFTSVGVDGGESWTTLSDVNVQTGHRGETRVSGEEDAGVVKLVLTTHGSIAWSVEVGESTPPRGEIYKAQFRKAATLVDSGPDVDAASLMLSSTPHLGNVISWGRGGTGQLTQLNP